MKRLRLIVPVALCLVLAVAIVGGVLGRDPRAPRFVPVRTQPTGPFRAMYYGWGDPAPVRDGKMWFWTVPVATNGHIQQFLYDFNHGRVASELLNATPVIANGDQTKLLCEGYSASGYLRWTIKRWMEKLRFGKGISRKINYEDAFWILDLRNNSAVKIGKIHQPNYVGGRFGPSPGFRYGFNKLFLSLYTADVFLCDLESNQFTKIKITGEPLGWWDEQNILFLDSHADFSLFNISTAATNALVTRAAISNFLQGSGLLVDIAMLTPICHWNGRDYDFLITQGAGKSFLLKLDRADLSLKLLYREFEFNPRGRLNNDCTHFVYDGEGPQPGKGGNGGVYLQNLTNNTTVTLVEPDNGGQYSLARFCDGGVIYWRKKHLWRIDLDGGNNVPLIPESAK